MAFVKLTKRNIDGTYTTLDVETALRLFKKQVRREGILVKCKEKEYFRTNNELKIFKEKNKIDK
jgi:ribosomal protein S21